jgi:hypothetical protein
MESGQEIDKANPQLSPQKMMPSTTSGYFGSPRQSVSRCKTNSRSAVTAAFCSRRLLLTVGYREVFRLLSLMRLLPARCVRGSMKTRTGRRVGSGSPRGASERVSVHGGSPPADHDRHHLCGLLAMQLAILAPIKEDKNR